jgi:hypothetical protein
VQATSELIALSYIGIRSARLEDWNTYATRLLGMQRVDRAGAVRAKPDGLCEYHDTM